MDTVCALRRSCAASHLWKLAASIALTDLGGLRRSFLDFGCGTKTFTLPLSDGGCRGRLYKGMEGRGACASGARLSQSYKQLARHPKDDWSSILAVLDTDSGRVVFSKACPALPFGASSAVLQALIGPPGRCGSSCPVFSSLSRRLSSMITARWRLRSLPSQPIRLPWGFLSCWAVSKVRAR